MILPRDIEAFMERLAPLPLACEWDNPGLLVDTGKEVTGVLCALDITPAVVEEAVERGCSLVVSHHPVIFRSLKSLLPEDAVSALVRSGVSAVCMHTNLDAAQGGVNDVLAALLGLRDVQPFADMGRIGVLERALPAADFVQQCQALFGSCRYTPEGGPVRTVAVLGGGGGDQTAAAFAAGADAYVTGEAAHHYAIAARNMRRTLVAAGHYETEHPVVPVLAEKLSCQFPTLPVLVSVRDTPPLLTLA